MVFIAGGPTQFGSDDGPPGTGPAVTVMLDSFYVDLHEVTAAQYDAFRVVAPKDLRFDKPARAAKDKQEPVLGINWGEANAYAKWAGKSLPTEPQWERAARGPDAFRAPWGNGTHIWHRSRAYNQIDLVQSFPNDVSPFGVFDMAGNAREWCLDWYAPDAADQLKRGDSTPRNPPGPKHGGTQLLHVVKGNGLNWNAVDRKGVRMTDRSPDIGFRCVLNLKTEEPEKPAVAKPEAKPKAKGKKKDQPGF